MREDGIHEGGDVAGRDVTGRERDHYLNADAFKAEALRAGAVAVGLAPAENISNEWSFLETYLNAGAQGEMAYLAREPQNRCRPETLLPSVKTVAVCAFSYLPREDLYTYHPHIAYFAQGEDYHLVVKRALNTLAQAVQQQHPSARCRAVVDTAPILEKAWAVKAGLGRIGRHNLLLNPQWGSYIVLGLLLTDLPADRYDAPLSTDAATRAELATSTASTSAAGRAESTASASTSAAASSALPASCLHCRACVEACPTGALSLEGLPRLNAMRCMAYATIEDRREDKTFPYLRTSHHAESNAGAASHNSTAPHKVFGCDRCQTVCPVNRQIIATQNKQPHPAFTPTQTLSEMSLHNLFHLTEADFQTLFALSPIRRIGLSGLKTNILALYPNVISSPKNHPETEDKNVG